MWLEMKSVVVRLGFAAAIFALSAASVNAQLAVIKPIEISEATEEVTEPVAEDETIEEIIVIGRKPGSRRRLDPVYEDPMRARLLKDLEELRDNEEEYVWLTSESDKSSSTVQWGYDPRDDYVTRDEIDLLKLPTDDVRPATLFKIGF